MEHRDQINTIVMEAVGNWSGDRHDFTAAWAEVRRRLRGLRDTATTLREDEQMAMQILRRL